MNSKWDKNKGSIIGEELNSFTMDAEQNKILAGYWWRVVIANEVVGYGWLQEWNGLIEISLAVATGYRGRGVAKQIIKYLEQQVLERHLSADIVATVSASNDNTSIISRILKEEGYTTKAYPIDHAQLMLEKGIDVNFYKKL